MKKKHPLHKWRKTKTPETAKVVAGDTVVKHLTLVKHKKYSGAGGKSETIKMDV